jgi:YfiH family protein
MTAFIIPSWPAPENVHAAISTRIGGQSVSPWGELNLAYHVGDNPKVVEKNWQLLSEQLLSKKQPLPSSPQLLQQVHGTTIVDAVCNGSTPEADGCYTNRAGRVCSVMTADCLPLLICNRAGTEIAAVHAGWRGLAAGIIGQAIKRFDASPAELMVYLGPAISQSHFEVGVEVLEAFLAHTFVDKSSQQHMFSNIEKSFIKKDEAHWQANIYGLATMALQELGVTSVYGGDYCTYADAQQFYSYRRDGQTGRMASLIWIS